MNFIEFVIANCNGWKLNKFNWSCDWVQRSDDWIIVPFLPCLQKYICWQIETQCDDYCLWNDKSKIRFLTIAIFSCQILTHKILKIQWFPFCTYLNPCTVVESKYLSMELSKSFNILPCQRKTNYYQMIAFADNWILDCIGELWYLQSMFAYHYRQ